MVTKYLQKDDEVKVLETHQDLLDYAAFRDKHDEWIQPYINEMAAVGIPNEPLFVPGYCKDIRVQKNGYKQDVEDIDLSEPENYECIEDTGLFLVFPYNGKIVAYPTRRIAYSTICKRADDDCGTMYRFDSKYNKSVLPINEKAERLCRDYQLYSDKCKILLRDGKVSAALSKGYQILPVNELIDTLENQLRSDHPDFLFDSGQVSHEYLVVEYLLNDIEMEESFRLKLNESGADFSTIKAGVRFATSDVGMSKVYANMFYDADGIRTALGEGIEMEHKGDASIEKFAEKMENLGNCFKECEERIEKLGNIDISDVPGCVSRICEAYAGTFPKAISEAVINELVASRAKLGTAIDVYLALNDIIQRHAKMNNVSPTRYLNLCEQVSKMMNLPYDKIDRGEDFTKI